jgi:hypothetical protein
MKAAAFPDMPLRRVAIEHDRRRALAEILRDFATFRLF